HGNDAHAAESRHRQHDAVVACKDSKGIRNKGGDLSDLRNVSRGLFYTDDAVDAGETRHGRRLEIAASAARHVVENDRRRTRFGDRAKVLVEPLLRGFIVIGGDGKYGV